MKESLIVVNDKGVEFSDDTLKALEASYFNEQQEYAKQVLPTYFTVRGGNLIGLTDDLDLICNKHSSLQNHGEFAIYDHSFDCIKKYHIRENDPDGSDNVRSNTDMTDNGESLRMGTVVERLNNSIYCVNRYHIPDKNDDRYVSASQLVLTQYHSYYYWKVRVIDGEQAIKQGQIDQELFIECQPAHFTNRLCRSKTLNFLLECLAMLINYSMLWALVTDMLLIINVYEKNDLWFFSLAIVVVTIPILFISAMIIYYTIDDEYILLIPHDNNKCRYTFHKIMLYIPIFNIPYFFTFISTNEIIASQRASMLSMILSGCMTYPLYLINVAYILDSEVNEWDTISIYNVLQIGSTLLVLCVTPFLKFVGYVYESYIEHNGLFMSLIDALYVYFWIGVLFTPIMAIEIVHFFPLLFAYYVDDSIKQWSEFAIIMILFNVPKLMFVHHIFKLSHGYKGLLYSKWFIFSIFMVLPLVPYTILMTDNQIASDHSRARHNRISKLQAIDGQNISSNNNNSCCWIVRYNNIFGSDDDGDESDGSDGSDGSVKLKCCNRVTVYYWRIVIYLWTSYVGSSFFLLFLASEPLSHVVIGTIAFVIFLAVFVTFTMPVSLDYVSRLSPHGVMQWNVI